MKMGKKDCIKKIMSIFFLSMLVFTVISKTISKSLLPLVEIGQVFGGTLEYEAIHNGVIGLDLDMEEQEPITIWAPTPGVIKNINIKKDQVIKKGDILLDYKVEKDITEDLSRDVEIQRLTNQINALTREYDLLSDKSKETENTIKSLQEKNEINHAMADIKEQLILLDMQLDLEKTSKNTEKLNYIEGDKIIAPVSGVVKKIDCYQDMFARQGEILLTIIPSDMEIIAAWDAHLEEVGWVETGDLVTFIDKKNLGQGTIISKQFNPQNNLYRMKATISSELEEKFDLESYNQLPCQIKLSKTSKQYDWIIPISAVVEEMGETYIYIIEEYKTVWGNNYKAKKIQVNLLDDDCYYGAVEMAISRDSQIIVQSSTPLQDGVNVRIE